MTLKNIIKEIKEYSMNVRKLVQKDNRLQQMQFHSHIL